MTMKPLINPVSETEVNAVREEILQSVCNDYNIPRDLLEMETVKYSSVQRCRGGMVSMKYKECKTEQAFKYEWIKRHKGDYLKLFCIETEETVKGFPDVLGIRETDVMDKELNVVAKVQTPCFMEFKLAKRGRIKFQPTQPAFYKAHKELDILVVSLAEYYGKYYIVDFPVSALFEKNGAFELNGMNEVDLRSWLDLMQENGDEVK